MIMPKYFRDKEFLRESEEYKTISEEWTSEKATKKFMARFTVTEKLANEKGIDMKSASLDVLDSLWDEAKALTK